MLIDKIIYTKSVIVFCIRLYKVLKIRFNKILMLQPF